MRRILHYTKRIYLYTICVTILTLLPLVAQAAPIGEFSKVEGRVDITSPGGSARPVETGDVVSVGDIIRTKSGSKAEITFIDESIIRIAQRSRVEIDEYMVEEDNRSGMFNLFRGKIQNIVKKSGGIFGFRKKNKYGSIPPPRFAVYGEPTTSVPFRWV